ncbi:MAG: rod shape-determining protein RodA [Deltaproteobacteria bacterium]|nr:MAG: rod shape-determining protein RodA [Deltaproteobacteria bacterium]
MFDRRLVTYFDWGLLGLTAILATIGVVTIYSAVNAGGNTPQQTLYLKQIIWLGAGLIGMSACFMISYKRFDQYAMVIYFGCVALVASVLVFGKFVGGSQRWLAIGPVSVQPSEMMKVGLIIALAHHYSRHLKKDGLTLRDLVQPMMIVSLPFVLILKQPDLGTAMMLVLIAGSMTLFCGIGRRTFILIATAGAVSIPVAWSFLKTYQKQRILTFLDPERDPLGAGYHIIQSKIAIGSGGITGKGYLEGTQNILSFLPEQHTDFIFSVLSEEWGFVGAGLVILLFLFILLWGLSVAHKCRDPFGILMSVGIVAFIFWEMFINIGMVMGLMPVVGVPLPLISYGGSSTITIMVAIGLLINVSMRRFMFE